jgi:hypothetical protein
VHPQELLVLVVEVAVAILGFAALVTTLGNVPEVMRNIRVRVIYQESTLAFSLALLALILLGTSVPSDLTWRICSALYCTATPMAIRRINEDRKAIVADKWSVYAGYGMILGVFLAQIFNLYFGEFWLFSVGLAVSLILAIIVFIEFFRPKPLE